MTPQERAGLLKYVRDRNSITRNELMADEITPMEARRRARAVAVIMKGINKDYSLAQIQEELSGLGG